MPFHDLYQKCREAFLVNSDLTLRAQLTEFRDHKLIRSKKVRLITSYATWVLEAGLYIGGLAGISKVPVKNSNSKISASPDLATSFNPYSH